MNSTPRREGSWAPAPESTDGEASNPGPCSLVSNNCSSLNTQLKGVMKTQGDIIGLSEARLTAAGQRHMDIKLREQGYTALWGAPKVRKRFNSRVPPGGVAVLLREPLQGKQIMPRTAEGKAFWEAGRLMHVAIPMNGTCVHVIVVYGFTHAHACPEQRVQNEALLEEAFRWAAEVGNVPFRDWGLQYDTGQICGVAICAEACRVQ